MRDVEFALVQFAGVLGGDDGNHAWGSLSLRQVYGRNTAFRDGAAHDVAIGLIGYDVVPLVSIGRGARRFQLTLDAVDRPADHLQLIDGVSRCGGVEFHCLALCFRKHGAKRAFYQLAT